MSKETAVIGNRQVHIKYLNVGKCTAPDKYVVVIVFILIMTIYCNSSYPTDLISWNEICDYNIIEYFIGILLTS